MDQDFDMGLALVVISMRDVRKGKEYPIEDFCKDLLCQLGKKPDSELPSALCFEEERLSNKDLKTTIYADKDATSTQVSQTALKAKAKNDIKFRKRLPHGKSLASQSSILNDILGLEYSSEVDFSLKRFEINTKPKVLNKLRCISVYQIKKLLSCFSYFLKHENTQKNLLILKIIMSCFKNIPQQFYYRADTSKMMLQEIKMCVLEVPKYELEEFSKIQSTKYTIVVSFYNLVLNQCEKTMPKEAFLKILELQLRSIVSIITASISHYVKRFNTIEPEASSMYCQELFKEHAFFQKFMGISKSEPKDFKLKILAHLDSGSLKYESVYYIIYYLLQLLKQLFQVKSCLFTDSLLVLDTKLELLSSLIMFDDEELIKAYNAIDWEDHFINIT